MVKDFIIFASSCFGFVNVNNFRNVKYLIWDGYVDTNLVPSERKEEQQL